MNNFGYMEDMAREYSTALKAGAFGAEALLSDAIELVERQIDVISATLCNIKPLNSSLNYLESLKRLTLVDLNNLKHSKDIAAVKCKSPARHSINSLINMQIDLFINLDMMQERGLNVSAVIAREERATSVISLIR
jgi:hypothetical protein